MTPLEIILVVSIAFIGILLVIGYVLQRGILVSMGGLFMLPFSFYVYQNSDTTQWWLLLMLVSVGFFFLISGAAAMMDEG